MIIIIIIIVTKIWNFDTVVGDRNGTYALQKMGAGLLVTTI